MRTHGLPDTYGTGCRCDACREAWRIYTNRRRGATLKPCRPAAKHATFCRCDRCLKKAGAA